MPTAAQDPIIIKATGQTTAVMYIGFASPTLQSAAISDYLTRVVQPLLATVDGVASADILGGQTFAMRLWLDPYAWRRATSPPMTWRRRSRPTISSRRPARPKAISRSPMSTPSTGLTDVNQFKRMVVKSAGGALVRMEDIANVELAAQSWTSSVAMNGQHAVFIGVTGDPGRQPAVAGHRGAQALFPEIERTLPPSLKMEVAYDSTKFIQASIDEVKMSLGQAVAIVVVVIFLFLGSFRSVVIPIVTIPLSLIGAGLVMSAMGFSLNLLTLLAMVLAIGLVVDDAIVVVENVYRHIEEGRSPPQAA
jgi:multidrug efflux pump